jgi:hypothetical protein
LSLSFSILSYFTIIRAIESKAIWAKVRRQKRALTLMLLSFAAGSNVKKDLYLLE